MFDVNLGGIDPLLLIPVVTLSLALIGYVLVKLFGGKKPAVGSQSAPSGIQASELIDSWGTTTAPDNVYQATAPDEITGKKADFGDKTRLKRALLGPLAVMLYDLLSKDFLRSYHNKVEVGYTKVYPGEKEIEVVPPRFIGEDFLIFAVVGGIIVCALALGMGYMFQGGMLAMGFAALVGFGFGFTMVFLMPIFTFERRKDEIEAHLPDVLEQLSTMSGMKNMDEIIRYLAETRLGAVSEEFAIGNHILRRNLNLNLALDRIRERSESKTVGRVLNLLNEGARRGVDVSDAAKKMAESMRNKHMILRERSASLSLQRYTLLTAAAILVPLILGIVWGISQSLSGFGSGDALAGSGIKFDPKKAELVLMTVRQVFGIYVVIHAVEASFSVARQEGDVKRAVIYLAPLAAISYLVFDNVCDLAATMFV
ncbi:MAG: hypothetical protein QF415_06120 [Candidatus Undinarchaeales archaeon]|nr:hypothetical protein [Candidatus Undinarchaeales archaeon]MDP7492479.1 hypothetical protein [Candidatus Undinarchaeales archaeon]